MSRMIRVGVLGLGIIGRSYLSAFAGRDDAEVVAIGDQDAELLHGEQVSTCLMRPAEVRRYEDARKLIGDKSVDLVVVSLPTPLHLSCGGAALRAGKHLLVEKPLAPTSRDGRKLADIARQSDALAMVGLCIRFWPGWDWLKEAISERRFGKVHSAYFYRLDDPPRGRFQYNPDAGGALFELHVHDVDFVQHCFGLPHSVASVGYTAMTGAIDHVLSRYEYEDVPIVVAEAGWTMPEGIAFEFGYRVIFERAAATYVNTRQHPLTLYEPGKPPQAVEIATSTGVEIEIEYLLDCIRSNQPPVRAPLDEAALATRIIEFEAKSIAAGGRPVKVRA